MGALLEVAGVTVRFGGLLANDDVSLQVAQGEIASVIGPNGAGKSTLFNVITGLQAPTAGSVRYRDEDITSWDIVRRARSGIARTFQNFAVVGELSALGNVGIGMGAYRRTGLASAMFRMPRSRREDRLVREVARRALGHVGLADVADARAGSLPGGALRRLELARALAMGPQLVLLDEPASGMLPSETEALAEVIRWACGELGTTVVLIEHDVAFVSQLAAQTTVLALGRVIASGSTAEVLRDPVVVEAYLGVAWGDRGSKTSANGSAGSGKGNRSRRDAARPRRAGQGPARLMAGAPADARRDIP